MGPSRNHTALSANQPCAAALRPPHQGSDRASREWLPWPIVFRRRSDQSKGNEAVIRPCEPVGRSCLRWRPLGRPGSTSCLSGTPIKGCGLRGWESCAGNSRQAFIQQNLHAILARSESLASSSDWIANHCRVNSAGAGFSASAGTFVSRTITWRASEDGGCPHEAAGPSPRR